MNKNFPAKNGRVTFLHLLSFNILPSFIKILRAVIRKKPGRTTTRGLPSTDVENCNATSSGRLNVRSTSSACRTVQPVRRHGNMARWPDGILSKNLITSQSNKKDYRKWSTTSHMALWIIQKHILVTSA